MTFQDAQPTAGSAKVRRLGAVLPIVVFLAPAVLFLVYSCSSADQQFSVVLCSTGTGWAVANTSSASPTGFRLAQDTLFWKSLGNNLLLALFSVLIQLPIALVLAVVLDSRASKGIAR